MTITTIQRAVPEARRHFRRGSLAIAGPVQMRRRLAGEDGQEPEGEDGPDMAPEPRSGITVESWNEADRTVEAILSEGADVERYDWWEDVRYIERLRMTPEAIRLGRLQSGQAPWLVMHRAGDIDSVVGVITRCWLDDSGKLRVLIRLADDEDTASIVRRIVTGIIRGVSVGYWIWTEEVTRAQGQLEVREAIDWEPFEGSSVTVPADPGSAIRSAPGRREPATMTVKTETPVVDDAAARAAAVQDAVRAENARASDIRARAARVGITGPVLDQCLADTSCTADQAAGRFLEELANKDQGTRIAGNSGVTFTADAADKRREALQDVMEFRLGLTTVPSDRARSLAMADFSLRSIARELLRGTELEVKETMASHDIFARTAKQFRSMGGIQTSSTLPALLENVANKALLKPLTGTSLADFEQISIRTDLPDFKQASVVELSAYPDLLEIPEGDDVKYSKITDGKDVWSLATYGRGLVLTFQAMMNDDLSGIAQVLRTAPMAVMSNRAKLFWAMFTANSGAGQNVKGAAMISAGHANIGTAGALAVGTVNELIQLIMDQKFPGSDDQYAQMLSTHIILPSLYGNSWKQLMSPNYLPTAAANAKTQLLMDLVPIVSPYLNASGTSTNKPYYVLSGPNTPLRHGTLQGVAGPQVDQMTDFDSSGIKMKVQDFFGVKAVDYHGIAGNLYGV